MSRSPFTKAVLLGRRTEGLYPQVFAAEKRDNNGGQGFCHCEGGRRALAHNQFAAEIGIAPVTDVVLHPFPTVANLAAFLVAQKRVLGGPSFSGPEESPLHPTTAATAITTNNDAGNFVAAREAYYAFMLPDLPGAPVPVDGQTWSEVVDTYQEGAPVTKKKVVTHDAVSGRPTMKAEPREKRALVGAEAQ